jgi:hypothetical protein
LRCVEKNERHRAVDRRQSMMIGKTRSSLASSRGGDDGTIVWF